jgi:hypothetical protein
MTTQENEPASPTDGPKASSDSKASSEAEASSESKASSDSEDSSGSYAPTEKPEPSDEHKEKAAEMMTSYEYRPTLVLPGSGGAVAGTAVNDWLDDEGNPKGIGDEDAPAAKAKSAEGESPEGKSAEGESPEGKSPEGESPEGKSPEGESPEGKSSEGESPEGKSSEGESADDDKESDDAKSAIERIGTQEQIDKDKEFNKAIIKAAESREGLSDEELAKSDRQEKSVTR